jgi:hypothetical protein
LWPEDSGLHGATRLEASVWATDNTGGGARISLVQ